MFLGRSTGSEWAFLRTSPSASMRTAGPTPKFNLNEGQSRVFVFKELKTDTCELPPTENEAPELFETSVQFWRKWLSTCTYRGRWREQVYRSALALKLLTFEPTGAIIASRPPASRRSSEAPATGTIATRGCETPRSRICVPPHRFGKEASSFMKLDSPLCRQSGSHQSHAVMFSIHGTGP